MVVMLFYPNSELCFSFLYPYDISNQRKVLQPDALPDANSLVTRHVKHKKEHGGCAVKPYTTGLSTTPLGTACLAYYCLAVPVFLASLSIAIVDYCLGP